MPLPFEWAREALKYTQSAINWIETSDKTLSDRMGFKKLIERIDGYLKNHEDTLENHRDKAHDAFYQAWGLTYRILDYPMLNEVNLQYLKEMESELYEYLGETPPANDPNQLTIDFNNGKPQNTI